MTVVDDGDYQGTEIFIMPLDEYQPDIENYIYTHTYYGSCSGCDTLQHISMYDDELPNEVQIQDYMELALHLLQKCKWFVDTDECLHCGTGKPDYCEKCYQKLIFDNMKLQIQIDKMVSFIQINELDDEISKLYCSDTLNGECKYPSDHNCSKCIKEYFSGKED